MKAIDLRSDTVTLPSNEIKDSIFNSKLGDDVFQEDPTVNELEKKAAQLSGKDSALLVPSGTMGNLVSFLVHCERGTEAILGDKSHTFIYEAGGISAFGGIHSNQVKNQSDGTIDLNDIKNSIRQDNIHFPVTSLISLENTHNKCHGYPIEKSYIDQVADIAKESKVKLHIDGARIFNAVVELNIDLSDLVENVDSLTFCLSKGLACPIGSVICGSEKFIASARRIRKALGGGMRQAGIIAAAGLSSLKGFKSQIIKDHKNAHLLSHGINQIDGLEIDLDKIKTNIIYFKLVNESINSGQFLKNCEKENILFFETSPNEYRMVTHYGITKNDIEFVLDKMRKIV